MAAHNRDIRAALAYHEATKHSQQSLAANPHFLDWENKPLGFKIYRDLEPIPLVRGAPGSELSALEAIAAPPSRPGRGGGEERIPNLSTLSRVLTLAAGITKRKRHSGGEIYFRAYPNTGALYHIDLYLVAGELPDLPAGVYQFSPHDFALRRLRDGDYRTVLVDASGGDPDLAHAPLIAVSASTFWRNAWKYQSRAYRHCFWDAGTLHANLLAVATAESLDPRVVLGFADRPVEVLLGLDPASEGALTLVPLGRSRRAPPGAPSMRTLELETRPLSHSEVEYPAIREMHAASSFGDAAEAGLWGSAPTGAEQLAPTGPLEALRPPSQLPRESLDQLIRRRGSSRAFDPKRSITFEELSAVLECSTRGVPTDFVDPPGATLLDLYVIAHAVEGISPGAYHYRRDENSLELLREGNFRRAAGRLGLMQQLPADAAANVYCLTDLSRALGALGNRGYRAAQLEGGITGGRMYLAAYAQRFGATGLTFFDDEVTEFFSPHAAGRSVMFLVALGHSGRALLQVKT